MPWFRTEADRVADELERIHDAYLRLLRQLDAHAELAPYPQVAERLRAIRATEERSARAVADRLIALGRRPEASVNGAVKTGGNAWERLVLTLEDSRALMRQLSRLWVRWDDEHPEDATLVQSLLERGTQSRDALGDLLARSDPHAID